ncbi:translocon-associated protein subunit delta-like [Gigantopelta aegis]|uniref:translocon-associated protein subunit delta-like n=1 Tax=Gigantopelta aegis TaxID=1735272 RepID=UPI001B88BEF2|nr:translocon-associated protein subunit delta-like [Gigantopelta aegis]
MASTHKMLVVVGLFLLPIFAAGDTCLSPQIKAETYTTPEITVSSETIFIVQFSLACRNGLQNLNLHAEIAGKTVPVTKVENTLYQVSIADEHKNLPAGSYNVKIYDEEGYTDLRKAQRSGDRSSEGKPLVTLTLQHAGVWKGHLLQSEFVAAMTAIVVWWMAYTAKTKLQA